MVDRQELRLGMIFAGMTLFILLVLILLEYTPHTLPIGATLWVHTFLSLGLALTFTFVGSAGAASGTLPSVLGKIEFKVAGAAAIFLVCIIFFQGLQRIGVGLGPFEDSASKAVAPNSSGTSKAVGGPGVPSQGTSATPTRPVVLPSVLRQYFSPDRRVRVEDAVVAIQPNGEVLFSFQAAAMIRAAFPEQKYAPSISIQFVNEKGEALGVFEPAGVARVSACGGYENHREQLSPQVAPRDVMLLARGFRLQLTGAFPVRC